MESHLSEGLSSKKWGKKIRQLRKEKGWSQADLAERLGVGKQAVSQIERGMSQFTLERLNRILDALGYDAAIKLEESQTKTRADWGPIKAKDPKIRSRIKLARQLAEDLAAKLYTDFDAETVYCFGSLVEDHGATFHESSDVDILVEGLEASRLFKAQSRLELDVAESDTAYREFSFDVVRNESLRKDPEKMVRKGIAVLIPEE